MRAPRGLRGSHSGLRKESEPTVVEPSVSYVVRFAHVLALTKLVQQLE